MKKLAFAAAALALSATAVIAASHADGGKSAIEARKALMQSIGASAGVAGAMMKGEMDYNPAVAKSVIASMRGTAHAFGAFFPEGTHSMEGVTASTKIWEDAEGFEKANAKFKADADKAAEMSGKDGPADLDAFKAAMGPVFGNCKACHEAFRVKQQ